MENITRHEQKERTRRKISDTAFSLYASKGFTATTNEIAQKAGIAHGSIFVHFPTREELQLHVLKRFAQELGNKLHALAAVDIDISELLYKHIGSLEQYEAFYKNMLTELSVLPEETRMLLISLQSTLSIHFSVAIEKGKEAGKVKDLPLHMLLNTWLGLLHYYLQNSELFAPGASVLKKCGNELVETFIALISK